MTATHHPPQETLKFTTKLAYGAGDMGAAITANLLVFFLLYFFTQVAGLTPSMAGKILMIGKIADAINDPIIGVMSDRTKTPYGRRIPWMLWGAIPFGLLFVLQWVVPQFSPNPQTNQWLLFGYYVIIGIVFNCAYTVVNLPYTALTPELTQDYNERTRLNSFRFTFSIGGSILSLILAGFAFQAYKNPLDQYWSLGVVCAVIAVISIFWCGLRIQERNVKSILSYKNRQLLGYFLASFGGISIVYGIYHGITVTFDFQVITALCIAVLVLLFAWTSFDSKTEPYLRETAREEEVQEESIPYLEQLKIVFQNKPFLYVIGIYLCSWLAVQLTASILPYFVVNWMGFPDSEFPKVALAVQGTALVLLYVGSFLSQRLGKKTVYYLGMSIWIIAQIGLFFLQPQQKILLYVVAVLAGFGVSVAYLIPWSMMPDVIEFDELQTGQRREGIFYGFMVLLQKFGLALGLFLVGEALSASGFMESIPGQPTPVQPESALLAIRLAIAPIPSIALIGGLVLAYFYPITQEVHEEIRLKLQERKQTLNSDSFEL